MSVLGCSLLVLVAHNGRTLQLDVQPSTRVEAVQQALVSFTGVAVADQIVMLHGTRLDANKPLSAYKLPVVDVRAVEDNPVFVYCRAYLKPNAVLPPAEVLPLLQVTVPPLAAVALAHPLHSASSPLIRALPDYERQFQHHLLTGRTFLDASQQRMQRCRQLLSEQEVQARAADAARANVEAHYTYICNAHQDFLARHAAQHAMQAQLLARFHDDLSLLAAVELHPALQTERWRRLIDLQPPVKLREWFEHCCKSHEHFGAKVVELEALFDLLKRDVEGLFMQAPSVDLDRLGAELSDMEGHLDEQSSIVQVLSKDLKTVKALVEDIVRQLGGQSITGSMIHDACGAMESIHDSHVRRLLPRVQECDGLLDAFTTRALACKNRMSRDVVEQLQRISAQQSRIRDMKNKLAAFNEVLGRQDTAFAELAVVGRLPVAYRSCLAECARRRAWHELYTGQAARVAEHMARVREKELARREAFLEQVERFLPGELLGRAGLLLEAPHCQISIPTPSQPLLQVTVQDLQRLASLSRSSSTGAATPTQPLSRAGSATVPPAEAPGLAVSEASAGGGIGSGGAGAPGVPENVPVTSMPGMEMENARLRAELANHIAAACLRDLASTRVVSASTAAAAASDKRKAAGLEGSTSTVITTPGLPGLAGGTPARVSDANSPRLRTDVDAIQTLQRALAMKDDLASRQMSELAALHTRNVAYERRIAELEALAQSYTKLAGAGLQTQQQHKQQGSQDEDNYQPQPAVISSPLHHTGSEEALHTTPITHQQPADATFPCGSVPAITAPPLSATHQPVTQLTATLPTPQTLPGLPCQHALLPAHTQFQEHHRQQRVSSPTRMPVAWSTGHSSRPGSPVVSAETAMPSRHQSVPIAMHEQAPARLHMTMQPPALGTAQPSPVFADSAPPTPSCTQILPPPFGAVASSTLVQPPHHGCHTSHHVASAAAAAATLDQSTDPAGAAQLEALGSTHRHPTTSASPVANATPPVPAYSGNAAAKPSVAPSLAADSSAAPLPPPPRESAPVQQQGAAAAVPLLTEAPALACEWPCAAPDVLPLSVNALPTPAVPTTLGSPEARAVCDLGRCGSANRDRRQVDSLQQAGAEETGTLLSRQDSDASMRQRHSDEEQVSATGSSLSLAAPSTQALFRLESLPFASALPPLAAASYSRLAAQLDSDDVRAASPTCALAAVASLNQSLTSASSLVSSASSRDTCADAATTSAGTDSSHSQSLGQVDDASSMSSALTTVPSFSMRGAPGMAEAVARSNASSITLRGADSDSALSAAANLPPAPLSEPGVLSAAGVAALCEPESCQGSDTASPTVRADGAWLPGDPGQAAAGLPIDDGSGTSMLVTLPPGMQSLGAECVSALGAAAPSCNPAVDTTPLKADVEKGMPAAHASGPRHAAGFSAEQSALAASSNPCIQVPADEDGLAVQQQPTNCDWENHNPATMPDQSSQASVSIVAVTAGSGAALSRADTGLVVPSSPTSSTGRRSEEDGIPDIDDVMPPLLTRPGQVVAASACSGNHREGAVQLQADVMRSSAASSEHMSTFFLTAVEPPDDDVGTGGSNQRMPRWTAAAAVAALAATAPPVEVAAVPFLAPLVTTESTAAATAAPTIMLKPGNSHDSQLADGDPYSSFLSVGIDSAMAAVGESAAVVAAAAATTSAAPVRLAPENGSAGSAGSGGSIPAVGTGCSGRTSGGGSSGGSSPGSGRTSGGTAGGGIARSYSLFSSVHSGLHYFFGPSGTTVPGTTSPQPPSPDAPLS